MSGEGEVYQRLKAALGTGEVIGIVYHGGSQPGAYREIVPVKLDRHQVRARCRMSNAAKVFNLDKVEIRGGPPAVEDGLKAWDVHAPVPVELLTIAEVEAAHRAALETIGWHVACVTNEDGDSLRLHRWTKDRSRPLKHPTVALCFSPTTYDLVATPAGGFARENLRANVKPWMVRGRPGTSAGPWKFASKALEAFLREAASYP